MRKIYYNKRYIITMALLILMKKILFTILISGIMTEAHSTTVREVLTKLDEITQTSEGNTVYTTQLAFNRGGNVLMAQLRTAEAADADTSEGAIIRNVLALEGVYNRDVTGKAPEILSSGEAVFNYPAYKESRL